MNKHSAFNANLDDINKVIDKMYIICICVYIDICRLPNQDSSTMTKESLGKSKTFKNCNKNVQFRSKVTTVRIKYLTDDKQNISDICRLANQD